MTTSHTIDMTAQRLGETEAAIREQRRYLDSLTDPALRAVATRTLGALQDMLLIMTRTLQSTGACVPDAAIEPA